MQTLNAPATAIPWLQANQHYLSAAIGWIRTLLVQHIARANGAAIDDDAEQIARTEIATARARMSAPPALEAVRAIFDLSAFECDLLLLCAAVEFDADIAPLCATAQHDPQRTYPTFGLALALLPDMHWSAITPTAPLRRWGLVEIGAGNGLTRCPTRIDERLLHYLVGVQYLDPRLASNTEPLIGAAELVPSQRQLADRLVAGWQTITPQHPVPIVQLCGPETASKRAIAAAAYAAVGVYPFVMRAETIPTDTDGLGTVIRLWEREVLLGSRALYLDCDALDTADTVRMNAVTRFIERVGGPVVVANRERRPTEGRPSLTLDVPSPTFAEQDAAWRTALGAAAPHLNGQVGALVSQFRLSGAAIQTATDAVRPYLDTADTHTIGSLLWEACRTESRTRLDDLAQRIESDAAWDDLVLPQAQRDILHQIAVHVRQRARVYHTWGFASKGARGLGISALFAGASGTGKTMAAEVLANELRLDLYRIDLSSVVSKYIGETEKNLRRLFDAAETGGAILLFDEADALFGKRSEVKDSHDRYANIEVSYLLQRMEAYSGLAILTTNLQRALDTAFLRRIRFVVQFPFPDTAQRIEIWRRVFPAATPTRDLQIETLARLNIAGGNIRNIAQNAAFLAADADEPVRMPHLLHAARAEYAKIEKPLTGVEVGDWA